MAASNFFVTVSASPSWAETAPAIEKARTAQVAGTMVRIFMCFLLLPHGRRPCAGLEKSTEKVKEKHQERERIVYHGGMAKPLNLKVDHSGKTTLAEQIRSECENASRVSARDVAQTSNLQAEHNAQGSAEFDLLATR